ncbi:heavy metal translocating P-type ATPase [Fluviibacterium sp. DFM31]|uniref:Heavy metal translocating P-type ATPase n=1 Tax=Meridianimarinicoccus marinus TaxID=3231483 RepID=A0ABV3L369_9RHOB
MPTTTFTFPVTGLTCAGCVRRAETAMAAIDGVSRAEINFATRTAQVDTGRADAATDLLAALDTAGYPARPRQLRLEVSGMHCGSCVGRVENILLAVPGVTEARVNLASGSADVVTLSGEQGDAALIAAVAEAGFDAHLPGADRNRAAQAAAEQAEAAALLRDTLIAGALTLPVLLVEMGGHAIPALHHWLVGTLGTQPLWIAQFLLISLVLAGPGRSFFTRGLPALTRGVPDMNALVALGTLAAWGYSTVATFAPGLLPPEARHVYFESAGVIVTLILLGRWLEARAKGRTGDAVRKLVGLAPDTAQVEDGDTVVERPLLALRVGDVLRIAPGARIPADGTVLTGASHVDESMITGEPVPVEKTPGAALTGGTVNGSGPLRMAATGVGADTTLARIIRMVEDAQGTRLPIQSLVNRVTLWFVPVVIGLATLTTLSWLIFGPSPAISYALIAGISVLVIACPCAMGLATPTSIMVGTGRAAELGILFRKGDALQKLQSVRVVAFDKTGTLTEGRPQLTGLEANGMDADAALRLAASVEALSEHPLAHAILTAAEAKGLTPAPVTEAEVIPGHGIAATCDGQRVALGNARMMARDGVDLAPLTATATAWADEGRSVLYLAVDGQAATVMAVSDPVKADAAGAVQRLQAQGLHVAMLTGDSRAAAQAIGTEIGVDEVLAELLPEDKTAAIDRLRARGPVAFVGDGINDAPALAAADVGLAIGTGTDIAVETADVVLTAGRPGTVATALDLSHRTLRNIRQNLAWAFGYNVLLIPVAAGLLYPVNGTLLSPALAAGAMAASSVFVVTNALRLRRAGTAPKEHTA